MTLGSVQSAAGSTVVPVQLCTHLEHRWWTVCAFSFLRCPRVSEKQLGEVNLVLPRVGKPMQRVERKVRTDPLFQVSAPTPAHHDHYRIGAQATPCKSIWWDFLLSSPQPSLFHLGEVLGRFEIKKGGERGGEINRVS